MRLRAALSSGALLAACLASPARADEVVRIAVALGVAELSASGAGLSAMPLVEGAAPTRLAGGRAVVRLDGDTLLLNDAPLDAAGVLLTADDTIQAAGLPLHGDVEVRRSERGLVAVHALPLEEYVAAVTGSEMPVTFPPEALRAQAVAARTFAVFKKLEALAEARPWHLGATVLHQVYRGSRTDARARRAAESTAGEVLVHGHLAVEAYFHSTCGGRTERGADALGRDLPYLPSVECGRCRDSPRSRWRVEVAADELGKVAGLGRGASSVQVVSRTASGRAERVELSGGARKVTLTAVDLRQRLGFQRLPSLRFEVSLRRGAAVFEGSGAGHGAGLCQWGAAGAARQGESYRAILARYYPGAELIRMY